VLAAIRGIERFDTRRPFGPWLRRIVANRSVDWLRLQKNAPALSGSEHDGIAPEPQAALAVGGELGAALAALDADDRAIVVMRHLLDLSSEEIGAELSMPAATVRTRLRRALEALRTSLGEAEEAR
jgi:RNA polymerase sigma-70 factor (ECF subfamily)